MQAARESSVNNRHALREVQDANRKAMNNEPTQANILVFPAPKAG